MSYGRNHAAFCWTNLRGENHEGRIIRGLQVVWRGFFFEGRSKGPPPFAELHGVVDLGIHLRVARIGDNGAAAKRARTELHAALKPTENFALVEKLCSGLRRIAQFSVADFVGDQRLLDCVMVETRA